MSSHLRVNGSCAHCEEHDPGQMESFVNASKEGDEAKKELR